MATPLFQPSHIVGNLIYLLFFFLRKEKEKKINKAQNFLFDVPIVGILDRVGQGWGICFIFFLFSTTVGFNIGRAKGVLG